MGDVARIALGLVFLVSGATKVVDRHWPATARAFGLSPLAARLLAPVELAAGAAVATGLVEPLPVVVVLGLLVAFSAAIATQLRAGRRPRCACFGAWSSRPVGPATLLRNAALGAVGVVALVGHVAT